MATVSSSFILESPTDDKPVRSSRAGTIRATDFPTVNKVVSPPSSTEASTKDAVSPSDDTNSNPPRSLMNTNTMDTPSSSRLVTNTPPSSSRSTQSTQRNDNDKKNNYDYNYYTEPSFPSSSSTLRSQSPSSFPNSVHPHTLSSSPFASESKHYSPSSVSSASSSSMSLTLDTLDKYHARVKYLESQLKKVQDEDGQKLATLTLALQQALVQKQQEDSQSRDSAETIAQLRHEINSLKEDTDQLLEEINSLRNEKSVNEETIEHITKERDQALDQLTQLEHTIQTSMENVQNVANTVNIGQQKLQQAEERIQLLQGTIKETEQRAENAETNLREARSLADQIEANLFRTQTERDQVREENEQLRKENERIQNEHIPGLVANSQENMDKLKDYYENEIQNLRQSFQQQLEKVQTEHRETLANAEGNMQAKIDRILTESEASAARVSVEAAEKNATLQLQLEQQKYDYEQEIQALRQNHSNELDIERERHSVMLQKEREQHLQSTLEFDKRMTETSADFVRQLNSTRAALETDMVSIRSTALAEKEVLQAQMQLIIDGKNKEIQELQELIQDPERSPVYKHLKQKIYQASVYLDSLRADLKTLKRELVLQVRDLHLYSGNIVNDCMRVTVQAIDQVYDLNDTAFGWAEESARLQHDLAIEQENNVSLRTLLSSERLESVHTTSRIVGYATHLRKEMEELRSDLRTLRESATDSIRQTQIEIYNGLADAVQLMVISAAKSGTTSIIDSAKSTANKFNLGTVLTVGNGNTAVSSSTTGSTNGTTTPVFTSPEAVQIHLKAAEAAVADAKADAERAYQRAKLNLTASDAYVATLQTERESLAKEVILLRSELERVGAHSNIRKKKSSTKYFTRGSTMDTNGGTSSSNYSGRPTVQLLTDRPNDDRDDDEEPEEDNEDESMDRRNGPRDYRNSNNNEPKNVFAAFQEVLQNNSALIASSLPINAAKPVRNTETGNSNVGGSARDALSVSLSSKVHSTSPAYFREAMNIATSTEEETNTTNHNGTPENSKLRIKKRK